MASRENTGKPKKAKPRGKPFPKGHDVGKATRWVEGGPSPNPGGRPKASAGFREKCRRSAENLRIRVMKIAGQPFTDTSGLVRAFEALADRGGYLPADKQAMVLLKALESPALKDADRAAVLAELLGQPAPSQAVALPPADKPKP